MVDARNRIMRVHSHTHTFTVFGTYIVFKIWWCHILVKAALMITNEQLSNAVGELAFYILLASDHPSIKL